MLTWQNKYFQKTNHDMHVLSIIQKHILFLILNTYAVVYCG